MKRSMTTKEEIRYAKKIADGSFTAPRGEKAPPRNSKPKKGSITGIWSLLFRERK